MTPLTMEYTETLTVTSCWCGIRLAIPDNLYRYARNHKDYGVHCPLGHTFVFRDSYEEKLERERLEHQATRDLLAQEEASNRAQRAAAQRARNERDRLKKRASAGVCPCCNRTFQQLARHMKSKHPDFVEEHGLQ